MSEPIQVLLVTAGVLLFLVFILLFVLGLKWVFK